jgi:UDP-3-O-[3-hydroxymyristoyl] glucosamine N-acyltransferase
MGSDLGPTFTLGEIARRLGGAAEGDLGLRLDGVRSLQEAGPTHLAFLAGVRYARQARESGAGVLLVSPRAKFPGRNLLRVADPYLTLARALELFHPSQPPPPGVEAGASVGPGCKIHPEACVRAGAAVGAGSRIGARAHVHAGAVIGENCRIGADSVVHPNVTLYPRTVLGERVIVHAGTVLGSDGFGFAPEGERFHKIPQTGWVEVEDDVEIGANSTIDRGTFGATRIGRGTKIDNLVQVGHNALVGENCVLVAQTGVAGSTRLGRGVMMAGQSGVGGHLSVGDGAKVGAKSAVLSDVAAGVYVIGYPSVDHREWKRTQAALRRLPELLRRRRPAPAPGGRRGRKEG